MGHQLIDGYGEAQFTAGFAYTADQAADHVFGYDSVPSKTSAEWDAWISNITTNNTLTLYTSNVVAAVKTAVDAAHTSRVTYIDGVLNKRRNRLSEIHADHVLKVIAPFELQIDLLDKENADVLAAKNNAVSHADDYFKDLTGYNKAGNSWDNTGRMYEYYTDRVEALDREKDLIERALTRAVDEAKPVDEVLQAMRIDWLQGVYSSGTVAYYDKDIYDLTVFDTEFDIFTYDMGHGKGHGHTN